MAVQSRSSGLLLQPGGIEGLVPGPTDLTLFNHAVREPEDVPTAKRRQPCDGSERLPAVAEIGMMVPPCHRM